MLTVLPVLPNPLNVCLYPHPHPPTTKPCLDDPPSRRFQAAEARGDLGPDPGRAGGEGPDPERPPHHARQLRHHFGPALNLTCFSAPYPPHPPYTRVRAVQYALIGAHAGWVLIGACNPMVCTIHAAHPCRSERLARVSDNLTQKMAARDEFDREAALSLLLLVAARHVKLPIDAGNSTSVGWHFALSRVIDMFF